MKVRQIAIFLENRKGRLHQLTSVLASNNINLLFLSIADTVDFGIVRTLVDDTDKAVKVLSENGFTVSVTELVAIEVKDTVGGLATVMDVLTKNNIDVEYLYSFARTSDKNAVILLQVSNDKDALKILTENKIKILSQKVL